MKKRFFTSAKRNGKTLNVIIPKSEQKETVFSIKATSTGKLHLSDNDKAVCSPQLNIDFVKTITRNDALKVDKGSFCKRCFQDNPHKIVNEMIMSSPARKKLTTIDTTKKMRELNEKARKKSAKVVSEKDTQIEALYKIIEALDNFANNDTNTRYMRLKTSCYKQALEAIIEMTETDNVEVLNRLIL